MRIKSAMERKGVQSAAELSRSTGIPQSTIRNYLIGNRAPPLDACETIGDVLGVSARWLFDATGQMDAAPVKGGQKSQAGERGALLLAGIGEALQILGLPLDSSEKIASVILLATSAQLPSLPNMSPEESIRAIVRWELRPLVPAKAQ